MKAYVVHEWGDIDKLRLETIAKPLPQSQEVLVRVMAAGLNPIDYHALAGALGDSLQLPAILGWDVSGVVESVGGQVTGFKPGDQVMGLINLPNAKGSLNSSGYAEFATALASQLVQKPAALSFEQAAALPAVGLTAWQALHDVAGIRKGQRIVIHGAAGGVGHMAVQIAKAAGVYVIATASGAAREFVQSLGADEVIDYKTQDFTQKTANIDVVLDTVGGEVMQRSLEILVPGGTLVTTMWPQLDTVKQPAAKRGIRAAAVMVSPKSEQLQQLAKQVAAKTLQVRLDKVYPFSQLPEALQRLRGGGVQGKLVVKIGSEK